MARPQIHSPEDALRIFRVEARFDPLTCMLVQCTYDVAVRTAQCLLLDKLERRARDKGLVQALALMPKDDYGFHGVFREAWLAAKAAFNAKHKEKKLRVEDLSTALAGMRKAGVVPTLESGVDHSMLPVRRFLFTLTYLRRADSRPGLTPRQLYCLCYGLGLVKLYAFDDYGLPRLSRWSKLVADVQALAFTPSMRKDFPIEAYFLAASVTECMRIYGMTDPPTPAALAEYIRVSEHLHTHPPFPTQAAA